jgi:pimeloyl-ACP methyl ester carboxylesterase
VSAPDGPDRHGRAALVTDAHWPTDSWVRPESVLVDTGVGLAVRRLEGDGHPVVLVHGLASNALLWRHVAEDLNDRGHAVACLDLRGHGRSDRPPEGHTTAQAAADLNACMTAMGWGDRRPIVAGQSWGGNVVLRAAQTSDQWGGVAAVDGGWIHLRRRFESFDDCWEQLAPPDFGQRAPDEALSWIGTMVQSWPPGALEAVIGNLEVVDGQVRNRLDRRHHRSIVHSLWSDDPADVYPGVTVPVSLIVAGRSASDDVDAAAAGLPDATVDWHPEAHHDIHLQHPDLVSREILALLDRVKGSAA